MTRSELVNWRRRIPLAGLRPVAFRTAATDLEPIQGAI
jgi:hypothetical protein